MRSISMETVEAKRAEILATLKDQTATHEQKVTYLARHAENFMTVLDEPEGLDELMRCPQEDRCICNLFEGDAPYRPRYICPDYEKFMKEGSAFLGDRSILEGRSQHRGRDSFLQKRRDESRFPRINKVPCLASRIVTVQDGQKNNEKAHGT